ncbi:MAG: hypothetical protein IKS82_01680 [Bacteroidales bacterium]|nr:hypothetical protein [Bacteroidales bacterium]
MNANDDNKKGYTYTLRWGANHPGNGSFFHVVFSDGYRGYLQDQWSYISGSTYHIYRNNLHRFNPHKAYFDQDEAIEALHKNLSEDPKDMCPFDENYVIID